MIGWKVDAGYFDGPLPTKLADIVFTDFSRPFTFQTWAYETSFYISNKDPNIIADTIIDTIGDGYYTMYGVPSKIDVAKNINSKDGLEKIAPSLFLSYPNLTKYCTDNLGKSVNTAIYFKSLNRVWIHQSPGSVLIIGVVESGNITYPFERKSGNVNDLPDISSVNAYVKVITNYSPNVDLTTVSITNAQFRLGETDRKTYSASYPVDGRTTYISEQLFTSQSVPDFSGNIPPDNPYEPGGPSGPGGGNGSFDNNSDQIVDSSLPTISSANTGFTRIYNPSLSQVQALARYLWTDESVIQTIWNHIKQYFEDPMQAIIGFNLVPVPVPNGGTHSFALMYIDTGVEMTVAASQFVDVDCGTLELKEYYGSALDYAPNTKVSCFLPFIGTVSLNTDEVMGRALQVKYRVDICSGSCVAKIAVDGNFIYQYSGHCAINIPISSADFSSYVSSAISVAQLAAGAIAAGAAGVMAPTAVDATQQTNQVVTTTQITNTARNPATGRQITTGTMTRVETREGPNDQSSTQASFAGIAPQNISNTVGQIMSSKPNINHSGSFSGNSGYLGVRRPFLIIERPNMCMPFNFQTLNGFPSMITLELSSCKGFTRVQQVQLTGFYATNPEQAEILQLLKSGVIL